MWAQFREKLQAEGKLRLKIKAVPGAVRTELREIMADGALKVAVAAAPEAGRANQALVRYIAKSLGLRPEQVEIKARAGVRLKSVFARMN